MVRPTTDPCRSFKSLPLSFMKDELAFETMDDMLLFLGRYKLSVIQPLANQNDERLVDLRTPGCASLQQTYDETFKKVGIKGAV